MQIVNQTVPAALKKLGYTDETIEAIVEFIANNGHVIDAPGLKLEHYDVFDCALGARSIAPMGHVRMMAACQPFLSGAISRRWLYIATIAKLVNHFQMARQRRRMLKLNQQHQLPRFVSAFQSLVHQLQHHLQ
jgi:hypothetical protein